MYEHRYEARCISAFVQQAVCLFRSGYRYYVVAEIPKKKDATRVDEKLIEGYGLGLDEWRRKRRKEAGLGNARYLRWERTFLLCATVDGPHLVKEREPVVDIREKGFRFAGYWIKQRFGRDGKWHTCVSIAPEKYRSLKAYMVERSTRWSHDRMCRELHCMPFEPWSDVRFQYLAIRAAVNRKRLSAGLSEIPKDVLRLRRKNIPVFVEREEESPLERAA